MNTKSTYVIVFNRNDDRKRLLEKLSVQFYFQNPSMDTHESEERAMGVLSESDGIFSSMWQSALEQICCRLGAWLRDLNFNSDGDVASVCIDGPGIVLTDCLDALMMAAMGLCGVEDVEREIERVKETFLIC